MANFTLLFKQWNDNTKITETKKDLVLQYSGFGLKSHVLYLHGGWIEYDLWILSDLAIIFVEIVPNRRQPVGYANLNVLQGKVLFSYIHENWYVRFSDYLKSVKYPPDWPFIVAQSVQEIWQFTSAFWCGWVAVFPIFIHFMKFWPVNFKMAYLWNESAKAQIESIFSRWECAFVEVSVLGWKGRESMTKKTK